MESCSREIYWGFSKIRGTLLGVPIRIIIGLYWGLHILGKYHIRVILGCVGRKKGKKGSGFRVHGPQIGRPCDCGTEEKRITMSVADLILSKVDSLESLCLAEWLKSK